MKNLLRELCHRWDDVKIKRIEAIMTMMSCALWSLPRKGNESVFGLPLILVWVRPLKMASYFHWSYPRSSIKYGRCAAHQMEDNEILYAVWI